MMDSAQQEPEEEKCGVDINEGTVKSTDLQENTNQMIGNEEELGSYGNSSQSDELVTEQYLGDTVKTDGLNQPQAECKSVGDNNEEKSNDLSFFKDIQRGRKQQTESGKILELVQKKKKQSLRAEVFTGSDARDRTVTSTVSENGLKKNQDSDISLPFRDTGLSEERDMDARYIQEDRKWLKPERSFNGVLREFTAVRSAEEFHAYSQKCKKSNTKSSDNLSVITEEPSDFISLKSEKKMAALWSKFSFSSWKNKKWAEDEIYSTEGVKLFSDSKQVITSVRASFETNCKSFAKKKESSETEWQISSDMDLTMHKEKCGVDNNERTGTVIDLQEKKKHNLRQIVWFPRNWLPLPRLGRDEIVGFVEEQTRDGHGGPAVSPAEHEELREMLRRLASDNVPGPQITMKYEMLRLCTMKTFPGRDRPFAIRIVGAGFYYAGHQDQVICYCCGNRKGGWALWDIPLLIHQKKAPNCGFLTHNALVNVPIRKSDITGSSPLAEIQLLTIQRSNGSNQSDMAQSESSLMLSSSEHNRVNISNMSCQMLVIKKSSPTNLMVASVRQNVLDILKTDSADMYAMEEAHPQYAAKKARINSFQGWPAELRQKPEEMAECGFYYAGIKDYVRCFCCGVILERWTSEDDPWIEHARWSASCGYVLKMKGEEFVSLVKMDIEKAQREKEAGSYGGGNKAAAYSSEASPAVAANETNSMPSKNVTASTGVTGDNAIGTAASTPSSGNTEIQKYLLTDAAQSVLELGYQPKLVQQAVERVLLKKGTEELTGQTVMIAVLEIEEENKVQLNPPGSVQSEEGHESVGKGARVLENASSTKVQIDPEKMREYRELYEASLCKICLENKKSVAFLPCGHLVTCPDCAPAMRKCPVCRELIKGTVKTLTSSTSSPAV